MEEMDKRELDQIVHAIADVVEAEEIFLFGSFAYGAPTQDSDFDLYVVLTDGTERPLRAIQKMNMAIARMDIRSVDILAEESRRFHEKCNAMTLERTVYERGVKLYERNAQLYQSMA
ncbi:nucleotidyltransferase domain-containing protein [Kineothrix sp. MB12-C1]|uniref:nucleotidyltransferase domain-containing protein n=1 Tax=Kineothrix sp. MB12-C1 TaxID=3070215 RepID=UPI0027D22915|nr:nucleotidyltransferase domain-containing protein [Kineothrix sp. MB12-C1]WMC93087.1 nucleotidyltransferase domain-containing protein [Kineothrix sp. MB12-C1]